MTEEEMYVWNRSLDTNRAPEFREGDKALGALLHTHGLICNGGVFHAVAECLSPEELKAACEGYRYFQLREAAELLEKASRTPWDENNEEHLNDLYYDKFIRGIINERFHEHFQKNRELYAPLVPPQPKKPNE